MKTITRKEWVAWRMQLGANRREAERLWKDYRTWRDEEGAERPVRRFEVASWQDWEREFRAWLDEMPRKPVAFLAMVAAVEKMRAAKAVIHARKAKGRERFLKRYARRRAS